MFPRSDPETVSNTFPITFFLLGAAKSGTTSLASYLDQHPLISMARVKETNYFLDRNRRVTSVNALYAQFDQDPRIVHRGDASHHHLSCPESADRILRTCPEARFVILLRDPVERAHSLYLHNRNNGFESIRTFERALKLETARATSKRFQRRSVEHPMNFAYFQSGVYDEQLRRYLELFPRERFLIRTYEEFASDPEVVLLDVHRFLGLTPNALQTYPRLMSNPGIPWFAGFSRRLSNSYEPQSGFRKTLARKLRTRVRPLPVLQDETAVSLRAKFAPSVERLEVQLGRSSLWPSFENASEEL